MQRLAIALAASIAVSPALAAPPAGNPGGGGGAGGGGAPPASTNCRVSMMASPGSWVIQGFDPFDSGNAEGVYSITYTNTGTGECRFSPVFELDQPPFGLRGGTGRPIGYALIDITNSLDVTPRAGQSQRRSSQSQIVLAPNASTTVMYRLAVAADDVRDHGEFGQTVFVEAQDSAFRAVGGTQVSLGINVLPSARIGLAGAYAVSDGRALVDLGELRSGPAAVPLNLRVNSTGTYSLSVRSANSGRLRLADTGWSVPYSLGVGGSTVTLAGGTTTLDGPQGAGYRRDALPLHFVIGTVDDLRAGTYRDTLTISVAPR